MASSQRSMTAEGSRDHPPLKGWPSPVDFDATPSPRLLATRLTIQLTVLLDVLVLTVMTQIDLLRSTLGEVLAGLENGTLTSVELVAAYLSTDENGLPPGVEERAYRGQQLAGLGFASCLRDRTPEQR